MVRDGQGSSALYSLQEGDLVRRHGGLRRITYRVKEVREDQADAWDADSKLHTFPLDELLIVDE